MCMDMQVPVKVRAAQSPGVGVTHSCEHPLWVLELSPVPQTNLLLVEPSELRNHLVGKCAAQFVPLTSSWCVDGLLPRK